jgi:hypothetical protein
MAAIEKLNEHTKSNPQTICQKCGTEIEFGEDRPSEWMT